MTDHHILHRINETLATSPIETYSNVVYQIKSPDPVKKEALKRCLKQGNSEEYHTVVEIELRGETGVTSAASASAASASEASAGDTATAASAATTSSPTAPPTACTPPTTSTSPPPLISLHNSPIYFYAKYIKLSREMCQTPLTIRGSRKTPRNVSDFTESFKTFFGASEVKFMASGREDIDVQCLQGRPFLLEIIRPTRNLTANRIPVSLYKEINLIDPHIVKKDCKDLINKGEPHKIYNLLIYAPHKLHFEGRYVLEQKTPLRVLHRRANTVRRREIEVQGGREIREDEIGEIREIREITVDGEITVDEGQGTDRVPISPADPTPPGFFYTLTIRASAGAYIKEWVNGDFGRTVPSLCGDLLELDVVRIEFELPGGVVERRVEIAVERVVERVVER